MMSVSGLGPVRRNLDPGKPFPAWAAGKGHAVNSPVEVTIHGKAPTVGTAISQFGRGGYARLGGVKASER